MCQQDDGGAEMNGEASHEADKLPRVRSLILFAAEEVGQRIEYDQGRL